MRSVRCGLDVGGMAIVCFGSVMACSLGIIPAMLANGVCPYTIWYRMHPRLQISLARPTLRGPPSALGCPLRIASGDM